eukprot:123036_1
MSLLSVIAVLINQHILVLSQTDHTISCDETRKGYRMAQENIEYTFQSDNDYALVYLEGCDSTHDIWLQIKNSTGHIIADEDDEFRYGNQSHCGDEWAGDITIPINVIDGEEYTFVIKGFGSSNGNYSVTLFCFINGTIPIPHGTCVYEPLSHKYACECIGDFACWADTISCVDGYDCEVICEGYAACNQADIIWPYNGTGTVTCDGSWACSEMTFPIPPPNENLGIFCDDDTGYICKNSNIYCPVNADCNIICKGTEACAFANIIWSPNLVLSKLECDNSSRACAGVKEPPRKSLYFLNDSFIFGPSQTNHTIINDVKITNEFQLSLDIYLNETVSNTSEFTVFSVQNSDIIILSVSINPSTNMVNFLAFSNINMHLPIQDIFSIGNEYNSITMTVSQSGTIQVQINDITYFDGPYTIPTLSTFENNETYSIYIGADNVASQGLITNIAIIRHLSLYFEIAINETCLIPYQTITFPYGFTDLFLYPPIAFWNGNIFVINRNDKYRGNINVEHGLFMENLHLNLITTTWAMGSSTQIDNTWYGFSNRGSAVSAINLSDYTIIWSSPLVITSDDYGACTCNNYSHLFIQHRDDIYTMHIQTQTWNTIPNVLPIRIFYAGCHIFEQKLYIFAGQDSDYNVLNSIYQYDIGTNSLTTLSATLSHNASVIQIIASKHFGYVFPNRGHGSPPQLHVFNFINHTAEVLFKLSDSDYIRGVGYHFVGESLFAYNFQSLIISQLRIEYAIATLYGLFDRSIFPGDILNISGDVSINKCGIDIKLPLEISFNLVSDDLSIGINHKIIFSDSLCFKICDYLELICKPCNEYQLVPIITEEMYSFSVSVIKTHPYILPQTSAFTVNIIKCPSGSQFISDWSQTIFPGDRIKIPANITIALSKCTPEIPTSDIVYIFDLMSDKAIFGINHKMRTQNGICVQVCNNQQSICLPCDEYNLVPTISSKYIQSFSISIVYNNPFFVFQLASFIVNIIVCLNGSEYSPKWQQTIFPGNYIMIPQNITSTLNKCTTDIPRSIIVFDLVSNDAAFGINHKMIIEDGICSNVCDITQTICSPCNESQLLPTIPTKEINSFSVSIRYDNPFFVFQLGMFLVNVVRCPVGSDYMSDLTQTIFPGDIIKIPMNITASLSKCTPEISITDIEFDLISDDAAFGINHKIKTENGICLTCDEYELVPTIPSKEISSFNVSIVYNNPFFLFPVATFLVNIDECNIGSGINADSSALVCSECEINQFKLTKGNEPCYSCNEQMSSDKIKCEGSDKILIAFNLWLYGLNENKQFISPFDVTQSDSILGIQCAPQHCCQLVNGCPFINAFDFVNDTKNVTFIAESGSVCAKNRNYSQPLCARCIDGTYEIFGTADCSECDSYNGLAIFLMIFAAILFVIFLIYEAKISDHSIDYKDEIDLKKLIKRDEIAMMMIMITKVMMYYFQGLNQIFTSKSITHSLSPILGLFDFSLNSLSSSSAGFCMFPFISEPLLEIVLGLFFIFCCLIHFLWVPFIVKILVRKYLVSPIELNIGAAAVKLFTISAGSILSSSFKLLGCITLPTSNIVYFYDPISKCFGIYWWIGLFSCVSVICLFAYWYRNISAQTETQRRDPKNIYKKLIKAYKPNTYYYEFILFSRRFIIAAFSSLRFMPSFDIDSILTTILVIYLTVHAYLFPFSYWRLNVLDSICMISLITILGVSSSNINKENEVFSNWFITICIIFPFGFIMYYFIKAIKMIRSIPKEQNETRNLRIQKLKNRAFIGMDESDGTKRSVSNVGRAESKGVLAENVQMKTNLDIYEKEEINVEMVAINNKNIDFSISSKMNVSNVDSSESKGVMDGNGNIQTNSDIYEKEAINAEMVVSNTDTSSSDDEIP